MKRCCLVLVLIVCAALRSPAQTNDPSPYHLTGHPWKPITIQPQRTLDVLEGMCRFSVRHQDASGAIIDPILHREIQYSTPYFAYAAGTLVRAGRAKDLLANGIAAMEHSTAQFEKGRDAITDQHSEFFIAALTESLDVYQDLVPAQQLELWRSRMKTPASKLIGPNVNNWRTYAMKGEWLRYRHGLIAREDAIAVIESNWKKEQKDVIFSTRFHLYHDKSSDPDTLSVEAVGRVNLLALVADGYDGPSADEIRSSVWDGTKTALLLQDPSGQAPTNGRTDDHVWPDVGYQLEFQVMANHEWESGNRAMAMIYQRAADLVPGNIERWLRTDGDWAGSFFITKNHFDGALRVGYQAASQISNYTGSMMFHMAEVYNSHRFEIPESPMPAEIGGYALTLDASFDSVMANAGGMQVQLNLRGQTDISNGNYWTPLGIVRMARANWDTRLGPSDGALTEKGGITFAPEFLEDGAWLRMASLSKRYRAEWKPEFVHPALVRGIITWHPSQGPVWETRLWITPDGVYTETKQTSGDTVPWAMTWPLLESDGRPLVTHIENGYASAGYVAGGDQETFISIGSSEKADANADVLRSTYGDLRPVPACRMGACNERSCIRTMGTNSVPRKFKHLCISWTAAFNQCWRVCRTTST